jgi:hypothetical protein
MTREQQCITHFGKSPARVLVRRGEPFAARQADSRDSPAINFGNSKGPFVVPLTCGEGAVDVDDDDSWRLDGSASHHADWILSALAPKISRYRPRRSRLASIAGRRFTRSR